MIIDGPRVLLSPRETWRPDTLRLMKDGTSFQRELSGHHQPVWRVRDRAPADNSTLIDPETNELHDVEFTVHRNRFTWDYRGETYTKQYYPPMLYRGDAPAELLIAEMDYAGVDMALLHTSPQLGRLNDYLADASSPVSRQAKVAGQPRRRPHPGRPRRRGGRSGSMAGDRRRGRISVSRQVLLPGRPYRAVGRWDRCAHSGTA